MSRNAGAVVAIIASIGVFSAASAACAQQRSTEPRIPMGPGSSPATGFTMEGPSMGFTMGGGARDDYLRNRGWPRTPPPDIDVLEAAAITTLSEGKADVVVLSRASAPLTLQLYRPELGNCEDLKLSPRGNTTVSCPPCGETIKFAFDDGEKPSIIEVERPSLLRIFPDPGGNHWQWDSFKVEATAKSK